MSEEKLYAIKNDEGKYWDFEDQDGFWKLSTVALAAMADEESAKSVVHDHGGHVVTLVEEPKKVVLSKEEAKIVEDAHNDKYPASYISGNTDGERFLMEAFVNGYTVAKEKKYKVRVPETQTSYYYKGSDGHVHASDTSGGLDNEFSDYELQQYGLDGERFTKEEVTDDEQ
ncbi:hypothetical protein SILAB01_02570 [Lacticaseibacillus paracasei]|nr:DUF1642 domain-containing protein [Lacticaseibacillus paracasei]GAV18670.1 hypothetical protein SILAB01_02570 [Lacticaseibacillus paracasei]